MKLGVHVYAEHAATIETDRHRWLESGPLEEGAALRRLSAEWDEPPAMETASLWLEGRLPENGLRPPYEERARERRMALGGGARLSVPEDLLWGNVDAEYPGAVSFRRMEEAEEGAGTGGDTSLTDEEIGDRLHEAGRIANAEGKGPAAAYPERRTSLSGMRGKIGLTALPDGRWAAAHGDRPNAWIAKREDSARLRGEAGIEAIRQDAMGLPGLPAAKTVSRMFADRQAAPSERADRCVEGAGTAVLPRHREDFAQAAGWPGVLKYDRGGAQEPRWPRWYGLLKRYGEGAGKEWAKPTRAPAATWLIGHGDRRRRNLGLQRSLRGEPFSVRLAPLYDVSSSVGVSALDRKLAIGVARRQRRSGVGPRQWLRQAVECGLDPEETLALARNAAGEMPEAVAAAGERAKTRDENRWQGAAGRRLERMIRYAKTRRRVLEEDLARLRTWSNDTATPRRRTGSGWPTSPPLARGQALCADLGGVRVPGRGER